MLTLTQIENTNIFEFTLDGDFTRVDFEQIAQQLEAIIAEHGDVRLIEVVKSIGSIEPSALLEDLKFAPKHLKHFSHVAVVADQKWIAWLSKMAAAFMSAEIRTFELDQLQQAREWIHGPQMTPPEYA